MTPESFVDKNQTIDTPIHHVTVFEKIYMSN